jgi:hypothetical protein
MTEFPNDAFSLGSRAGDLAPPDATSTDKAAPLTESLAIRTLYFLCPSKLGARDSEHLDSL